MKQHFITDDLEALLNIFPSRIKRNLTAHPLKSELVEVIMDVGRVCLARFDHEDIAIGKKEVTYEEIDFVTEKIGRFGGDNRAGIERTLHRISGIRNRTGKIIGLTCRVGRSITGTVSIIQDLIEQGSSILLMGRPGVGKTTMLREIARILADNLQRRVVIVDTSNEIAGDGDIPHAAIGRARRLQVPLPEQQHEVMIEAVENHTPQVVVIDEIGRVLEAEAARTIAERGVQLIATAHGNTLQNLMMNPTLNDLIGGIQSVTLGDDEARRRGTQKLVLERQSPPTFDVVIEIIHRGQVTVHPDVAFAVDELLKGNSPATEVRTELENGEVHVAQQDFALVEEKPSSTQTFLLPKKHKKVAMPEPLKIFPLGISRHLIKKAAVELEMKVTNVQKIEDAKIILILRKNFHKRGKRILEAEQKGIPVYLLQENTYAQILDCLSNLKPQQSSDHLDRDDA